MMQAASEGAMEAGNVPVAAVRIAREASRPTDAPADVQVTGSSPSPSTGSRASGPDTDPDEDRLKLASYLPPDHSVMCVHMATRKAALSSCGLRMHAEHRTAYIFLPGGMCVWR